MPNKAGTHYTGQNDPNQWTEADVITQQHSDCQSISSKSTDKSLANGIAEIEAVTQTWSKWGLYGSWVTIFVLSVALSLMIQTMGVYTNYATSSFNQFSLLSTLQVVEGVINVVVRPPLAKFADSVGRFESFLLSIVFLIIGIIMLAASPNIGVYFAAQVFYTTGKVGIQFMNGIFASDTSDLVNRAFFTVLPNICFLFMPWTSGPLTSAMLKHSTWRWGIATWSIVVPACAIPLLTLLLVNRFKAKRTNIGQLQPFNLEKFIIQLDLGGSILLAAALSLVFVAIPLASSDEAEWKKAHIIVMIVIGGLCLIVFPLYEAKYPKYPILKIKLLRNFHMLKTFVFIMFYYLAYYIYAPYFFAWLLVVFDLSNTAATNVNVVVTVCSTLSGTLGAIAIKYTRNIKWFIVVGNIVHMIGIGLIYNFRRIGTSTAKLVIAQAVDGLGAGLLTTPNRVMMQTFCSHAEVTQTTGLYLSFLSIGQIIGDAVSGSVYRSYYPRYLRENLPGKSEKFITLIVNDYTKALKYSMDSPERIGIIEAYNSVMRILLIPPFVFYGIMIIISVTYPDVKLDKVEDGLKGVVFGRSKPTSIEFEEERIDSSERQERGIKAWFRRRV